MKSQALVSLFVAALVSLPLHAAEEADPAMAALKRMREQLRTVMLQQQKTEADRAALEAAKVELEGKNKDLETKVKSLVKESNTQKEQADKEITSLKTKVSEQERELARLQESLANWKKGHQEVTDTAKKIEAQRAELSARVILLDRKVADYQRKNDELFKIGNEVLSRYEGFGLGTAIAAREPFTGNMRVKLESLVQDYGDKLADNKITPGAPAPKADTSKAQKPSPTTQSGAR